MLVSFALAVALAGCAHKTAPLPAWAINGPDASIGATIAAADAAVNQFNADVKAGFVPAPEFHTVMQDLQKTLAVAQPAYKAWHGELKTNPQAGEPAALTAALLAITNDLTRLSQVAAQK